MTDETKTPEEQKPEQGVAKCSEAAVVPPAAEEASEPFSKEQPLLIQRIQKNKEGGVDFEFHLSEVQTYVLLNFAIGFLMAQGMAQFVDTEEPKQESVELGERIK